MKKLSDQEILAMYHQESTRQEAFTVLVKQYQERLYWLIRRMVIDHDDADDVLQNTLIKIWKGLPFFRENSALFSWIYRIAQNEALSFLKVKRREMRLNSRGFCEHLEEVLDDHHYMDCNAVEAKLQKALLTLPDKQRLVFHLRYYDEMPYEEMAKMLGTSEGALKASYHHAVKKIEKSLCED
jgi:RNA polymerase sigma factor (sigma-70 family)